MIKRGFILTIILYFLVLLETSFFVHFEIFRWIPNSVLVFLILYNILESSKKYLGLYLAVAGGLFMDIFSVKVIGFHVFLFLIISLSLKFIFKRYVRVPFFEET